MDQRATRLPWQRLTTLITQGHPPAVVFSFSCEWGEREVVGRGRRAPSPEPSENGRHQEHIKVVGCVFLWRELVKCDNVR